MEKQITIWTYTIPALLVLGAGYLLVVPTFWGGISELINISLTEC